MTLKELKKKVEEADKAWNDIALKSMQEYIEQHSPYKRGDVVCDGNIRLEISRVTIDVKNDDYTIMYHGKLVNNTGLYTRIRSTTLDRVAAWEKAQENAYSDRLSWAPSKYKTLNFKPDED